MHKRVFQIVLVIVLQLTVIVGGWTAPAWAITDEQKLISETWRIVNRAYVDETFNHQNWWFIREKAIRQPLENREETYQAIEKMLASLDDPFTRLLKPNQYRSLQVSTSGELTGVGLQIALDAETGQLTVIAPIDGSPAAQVGIQPRDRILKIDDFSTAELTLDEAATHMRGPIGSTVRLTVERFDTQKIEEIELQRDRIALNPVFAQLHSKSSAVPIGYIRLSQFSANATEEVASAIQTLNRQGAKAYILDLRNNPGGLLQAGVEIARLWLEEGTIVYTVNRQGVLGSFDAVGSSLTQDPLVVLVNQGTASASEILAGALQDNQRAQLVGEKTFGKGLIQSLFDLPDGSGLAVTVAKYETPAHHDINKLGIKPDQIVPTKALTRSQIATEADPQYQAAVELLVSQFALADAS
ncbi:MAG: PDZ domain-containing protein [Limnoraphis sp. WC205]|jgi:carboxyl-terminal processing protease|nr:PDZ domain-containing protein [Limnoraphis sp. WC205]